MTVLASQTLSAQPVPPAEMRLLAGGYYLIEPLRGESRIECTCVASSFAAPRIPWSRNLGRVVPLNLPPKAIADANRSLRTRWIDDLNRGLLNRAIANDDPFGGLNLANAQYELAQMLVSGVEIGEWKGPYGIAAGASIYQIAAERGQPGAEEELGYLYLVGLGVQRSEEFAAYWLERSATHDGRPAQLALGLMYALGRGVPRNPAAAMYWFTLGPSPRLLGDAYACGLGVPPDLPRAVTLYEQAAASGDIDAQYQLATMYSDGCGVGLDDEKAVDWFSKAADSGHPEAQIALSEKILKGEGVPPQRAVGAYVHAEMAARRLPPGASRTKAMALRDEAWRRLPADGRQIATDMFRLLTQSSPFTP